MAEPVELDPHQVPRYPVYRLVHKKPDDETGSESVELDGIPVEPAAGQAPLEAAVAAIARKATEQNRHAVRVLVNGQNDEQWSCVVTRDQRVIDLDAPGDSDSGGRSKKALVIGGLSVAGLAAVAAGTFLAVELTTPDQQPAPEPETWEVPNAGAQVPAGLPESYENHATWAMNVRGDDAPVPIDGDSLVVLDPEGRLIAIDEETAQPLWHSSEAPRDMTQLRQSTWAGETVLIEARQQQLRMWPIPEQTTTEDIEPHTVELSNQAEVTFAGDSPLVDLGDFVTLADNGAGTLTEIEIPAGATPLLVAEGDVVSIDAETIYRSPIGEEDAETQSVSLDHHSAAESTRPNNVWPINDEIVAATYEGSAGPLMQLFSLDDGERIAAAHIDSAPRASDQPLVDESAETAVIGAIALQWTTGVEEPISELSESLREPVLHGTTLWGLTNSSPALLDLSDPEAEPRTYESFRDADPIPRLVTDAAAYIIAPRVDDYLLYRVASDSDPDDQETTEETEDDAE